MILRHALNTIPGNRADTMQATSNTPVRTQLLLAALLATIAGYVDSYAVQKFAVFASFMSGNTTQTGLHAGLGQFAAAAHQFLPIPCFVAGVAVGAFLLEGELKNPVRRLCGLVAVMLAVSAVATRFGSLANTVSIITASFGMGAMNTVLSQVGRQSVSLGFVSGDLNQIGRHLALAVRGTPLTDAVSAGDTRWRRAGVLAIVWLCFLTGAGLAGVWMLFFVEWTLIPPLIVLCYLAAFYRSPQPS
ncbi:hypothetical protein Pan258_08300 [Symmachiella dynata]|uniref:YoaK family protein n=1 Tax=Symmachiella dynata TaxID=2527995 RepID=UPI00118D533B|nr:YoaK family protein [Symmachiella dynata]QDT46810.1 hypothetical protein Pan258_08300 [Symmachiella dynata]